MLIRVNIKNFLSFDEREYQGKKYSQEFSMLAGKVRNKNAHICETHNMKIMKFAAIYGANAAGKSNVVNSINFIRNTILDKLPQGSSKQYCRTNPDNKTKPSYFEVQLTTNNHCYSYGFEVILSTGKFVSEWLVEHIGQDEREIFTRDIPKETTEIYIKYKNNKELYNKLKFYSDDISNDDSVLFLSVMNQNKNKFYTEYPEAYAFYDVYDWFRNKLKINYPNRQIGNYTYMLKSNKFEEICDVISLFGTGITGYDVENSDFEKTLSNYPQPLRIKILSDLEEAERINNESNESNPNGLCIVVRNTTDFNIFILNPQNELACLTILFRHGNTLFELNEESDGTIRLLDLLEILILGNDDDSTYIIDELDRCLHPSLTYNFVKKFLMLTEKRKLQLIVTTHESRLLDFDLLRRDEIWFVNKRSTGESDVYSLDEFNERFDKKIDKAYLEGRYGGIPVFNTLFPIENNSDNKNNEEDAV